MNYLSFRSDLFFRLCRLRSVRRQLGRDVRARLVSALLLSRLNYCNAVFANLAAATLAPLQRVPNAAARLVLDLKPRDHYVALVTLCTTDRVQAQSTCIQVIHWSVIKLYLRLAHTGRRHNKQHARLCAPPAMSTSFFHGRNGESETARSLSLHLVRGIGHRQN